MLAGRPDDLWDDVARTLDDDEIPDADVLAPDVVLVVESRARDGHAPDVHRLELGERVQHPRSANPHMNLRQTSDRGHRCPLVGASEAWTFVE